MTVYHNIVTHKLILLLLFTAACHLTGDAQGYSFTQYNIKEGLAGSTVYCTAQDTDGFMWFGTETGLSRFDGSRFRNFTTADGLPTNEILKVFCDSRDRVWLSLFKNDLCYYYKGNIHNRYNDSVLKNLHMTDIAWQVCEDRHGNILVMEQQKLHKIEPSGKVTDITMLNTRPISLCLGISKSADGNFLVLDMDSVFELHPDGHFSLIYTVNIEVPTENYARLSPHLVAWKQNDHVFKIASLDNKTVKSYPLTDAQVSFNIMADTLVSLNSINGALLYDPRRSTCQSRLVPGKTVSGFFIDRENNYWCTTLGSGVYRINSLDFRNITFYSKTHEPLGVYTIYGKGQNLLVGTDKLYLYKWDPTAAVQPKGFLLEEHESRNRIIKITRDGENNIIIGSDIGMAKLDNHYHPKLFHGMGMKDLYKINDDSFLVATTLRLLIVDPDDFHPIDTILEQRTNATFFRNDTFYAGTLDGLVLIDKYHHSTRLGDHYPVLENTITGITSDQDGLVWISTYGAGVVGYYQGKVVANITEKDGLTTNICRCLYLDDHTLWVGTTRGLNKINLSSQPYHITKITSADALASDIINTVYVTDGIVYAGTPEGISYFDAGRIVSTSICNLRMTRITTSRDTLSVDAKNFTLSPEDNDISFRFAGISFKSGGDITYYYRLKGLDTGWHTTFDNIVSYTTLPSGKYTLEMKAVNKFGVVSNPVSVQFNVAQTLWEKTWFRVAGSLMLLLFMWLILVFRTRYIKKRSEEKLNALQRMNELEQMALKSQMNPHFIFNSLNSIQQFVMDKDVEGANKFITGFSKLIRRTLEFSTSPLITAAEEIEYLSTYLQLEQERFAQKFSYHIHVGKDINVYETYLPPMILQPYVENSVRHGMRYRNDNNGVIHISFEKRHGFLEVQIEDNGVGRKEAAKYKSENIIQYQSKGISLTATRVEMMNKKSAAKVKILIEDLEENGVARGTRVTVVFPTYDHGASTG